MLGRSGVGAGAGIGLSVFTGERDPVAIARNALLGAVGSQVANNPKILGMLVKGMSEGGSSLTNAATVAAGSKAPILLTLLSQTTGQGIKSVVQPQTQEGITQGQGEQQIQPQQGEYQSQNETNQNMFGQQPSISQSILDSDKIKQLMVMDLLQNGGKNMSKIQALDKIMNPTTKAKSAAATQVEGKANAGLNAIDRIEQLIQTDPSVLVKASLPGAPGAREYKAMVSSLTDAIGGLRTGASVSKEQQKFYEQMLPKVGDSPQTILAKIAAVKKELQGYAGANISDSGSDILQSILGGQQ
jgi:hypothetical protein